MSEIAKLPVDHEYAPGATPTPMERFEAILMSETTLTIVVALVLFLALRKGVTSFTEARVAKKEARRRFDAEQEAAISDEIARLRAARDAAGRGVPG